MHHKLFYPASHNKKSRKTQWAPTVCYFWEIQVRNDRVGEISSRFNWSSAHVSGREVGICAEVYSWDLLSHHHPPKMHTHPSISTFSIMLCSVPRTFYSTFSCCSPSKGEAAHSSLFCEAVCAEWLSLTHFWPLRALQITLLQNLWEWQFFISPSIRLGAALQQNWISIASVFSETDSVMRYSLHVQKTAARTQIYHLLFSSVQSETWKHYNTKINIASTMKQLIDYIEYCGFKSSGRAQAMYH